MKRCVKCEQMLRNEMFFKNKKSRDGLRDMCRKCHGQKIKESNDKHLNDNLRWKKKMWVDWVY